MLTMRLDLAGLNTDYMQSLALRLPDLGIMPTTLADRLTRDPAAIQNAYACHNQCRTLQPPVEIRTAPIPYERWLRGCVDGPEASSHLYFIAMHQDDYIGVCLLQPDAQHPDTVTCGFTGVLPTWSGRGIARALKAYSLLIAIQRGFQYADTGCLVVNRGMCAINRSLGFQVVKKRLLSYPIPVNSHTDS
jgi:GNAT superfamily N-acetyltransferase